MTTINSSLGGHLPVTTPVYRVLAGNYFRGPLRHADRLFILVRPSPGRDTHLARTKLRPDSRLTTDAVGFTRYGYYYYCCCYYRYRYYLSVHNTPRHRLSTPTPFRVAGHSATIEGRLTRIPGAG